MSSPTPELDVVRWFNSEPLTWADLRGKVVLVEAFQMLCPGCVTHSLPQAQRVRRLFPVDELAVIGLHTVFEHHDVMGPDALEAFLSEYRITFPVAVDRPVPGRSIPATMAALDLQGTPSHILLDRRGERRAVTFGSIDDIALGARIGRLLAEPAEPAEVAATARGAAATANGTAEADNGTAEADTDDPVTCAPGRACA